MFRRANKTVAKLFKFHKSNYQQASIGNWFGIGIGVALTGSFAYSAIKSYKNGEFDNINMVKQVEEQFSHASKNFPYVTILIGGNIILYVLGHLRPQFAERHMVLSLQNIRAGRIYTLMTSAFMHRSPLHLFLNMYILYSFKKLEMETGTFYIHFYIFFR